MSCVFNNWRVTLLDTLSISSGRTNTIDRDSRAGSMKFFRRAEESGSPTSSVSPQDPEFVGQESLEGCDSAWKCLALRSVIGPEIGCLAPKNGALLNIASDRPIDRVEADPALFCALACPAESVSDKRSDEGPVNARSEGHRVPKIVRLDPASLTLPAHSSLLRVRGPPVGHR